MKYIKIICKTIDLNNNASIILFAQKEMVATFMERNNNKKEFFSISEFEKEFLPKTYEKKIEEDQNDAYKLGISMANKSLEKIQSRLHQ